MAHAAQTPGRRRWQLPNRTAQSTILSSWHYHWYSRSFVHHRTPSVADDYSSSASSKCCPPSLRSFDPAARRWETENAKPRSSHSRRVSVRICGNVSEEKMRNNVTKHGAYLSFPSKLAQQLARASYGTPIRRTIVSGRIIGRKLRVCGLIAVTNMTGFSG